MAHLGSRQDRWRPSWIFVNLGHFQHSDCGRFFTLARRPYFQAKAVEKLNKAILLALKHLFTGLPLCFGPQTEIILFPKYFKMFIKIMKYLASKLRSLETG